MKKKIFFAIATGFFAVATVFNMNALQGGSVGDISLDAIAVMAQADGEAPANPDVWYRRGTWTRIEATRTVTRIATVDMWVPAKFGLIKVSAGSTYTVVEEYVYWDCIGWVGRC